MTAVTRRQVLRGAGGFTLALPLMASLRPRGAKAAVTGHPPRFVALCTDHGGVWSSLMYPDDAVLGETMMYAGHTIRRGDLARQVDGAQAFVSPVLRAAEASLPESLVPKLNVLRGLDHPFYIGHHVGGHLGNYAANDGNGEDGLSLYDTPMPTIDQVLAWSSTFHADLTTIRERSLVVGPYVSWGFSSPSTASGSIVSLPWEYSSLALFNRIFVPEEDETNPRPPVVDRVLESYRSMRESNLRLSADDRRRLDEHMERIDELQRKLAVSVSCGDVAVPGEDADPLRGQASFPFDPSTQARYWQLYNEVVAAAFTCGTSRIAAMHCIDTFSDFQGDWHQDVAHQAHLMDGAMQNVLAAAHQRFFEDVFLDLCARLDVPEGGEDDSTILDNTLVAWSQESGNVTHESISQVVVTAGSAAGCLRTGQYVDYRNRGASEIDYTEGGNEELRPGLVYNQWLGTVLQAMGLSNEEFQTDARGGYGTLFVTPARAGHYPSAVLDRVGEWLPWLRA
jgi:hypothetical protein